MSDIRRAELATAVWIPLRAVQNIERTGKYGFMGFKEEFFGAGSEYPPPGFFCIQSSRAGVPTV